MTTQPAAYRLLVVDPCQDTQTQIEQQLQGRGFSIRSVSDPSSAVATFDSEFPDIVITDLFLPEKAGLTLVEELFARREYCPIVVMAMEATEQTMVEVLRTGAVDYLHKPIIESELAHVLQRAKDAVPSNLVHLPGLRDVDYQLSIDSDPAHIQGIVSWLIKTTASTFSPIRQLQLRGALQELLFNAIEHGNLEISGREKHQALMEGRYDQLVAQRRTRGQLRDRSVTLRILYDRASAQIVYRIADEGSGFCWQTLFGHSHEVRESEAANGRGIFLTRAWFPALAYNDRGNEVTLTVPLS